MLVSCMPVGCLDFVGPIQKSCQTKWVHEYFKKSSVLDESTFKLFFTLACQ